ncbi:DUF3108 domain-containing protein [Lysobacter olei]
MAFVAATLLATAPAMALEPFTADYQANYMGMQANGRMTLAAAGEGKWRYNLSIQNALANLSQTTVFQDVGGQWRPLTGTDTTKLLVKSSVKNAAFDWSRGVATWSGDVKPGRAGPVKLQAGDMDALLVNLALVRDVLAGKPLVYRLVENGKVKVMKYTVAGKEQITVGGKPQQATKVINTSGERQTIAWVVEGMPVPARILQRDKGSDEMDLRVHTVR